MTLVVALAALPSSFGRRLYKWHHTASQKRRGRWHSRAAAAAAAGAAGAPTGRSGSRTAHCSFCGAHRRTAESFGNELMRERVRADLPPDRSIRGVHRRGPCKGDRACGDAAGNAWRVRADGQRGAVLRVGESARALVQLACTPPLRHLCPRQYEHYCFMGKWVQRRLEELGGRPICASDSATMTKTSARTSRRGAASSCGQRSIARKCHSHLSLVLPPPCGEFRGHLHAAAVAASRQNVRADAQQGECDTQKSARNAQWPAGTSTLSSSQPSQPPITR